VEVKIRFAVPEIERPTLFLWNYFSLFSDTGETVSSVMSGEKTVYSDVGNRPQAAMSARSVTKWQIELTEKFLKTRKVRWTKNKSTTRCVIVKTFLSELV
jgi:hypothetical protein